MKTIIRPFIQMITVIGLIITLSACSGSEDNQATSIKSDAINGGNEQVLNLSNKSQILTMDSAMATDEASFRFLGMTMEGLYRLGENAEIEEGIAIDHEQSEDGLEWTFKLREDAVWSSGDPVTAHEFVYAWQRVVDPETGSEFGPYMMNDVIKNPEDIHTVDKDGDDRGVAAI